MNALILLIKFFHHVIEQYLELCFAMHVCFKGIHILECVCQNGDLSAYAVEQIDLLTKTLQVCRIN